MRERNCGLTWGVVSPEPPKSVPEYRPDSASLTRARAALKLRSIDDLTVLTEYLRECKREGIRPSLDEIAAKFDEIRARCPVRVRTVDELPAANRRSSDGI